MKYYFRVGPKSGTLATGAVNFAIEAAKATGLAPKKVAILADDTTFSQSSVKGVLRDFPKTGWTLAENISYPGGGVSDFATIIQRLKLTGVDLLIQSTFPADGIQINRAMKAVDYDPIAALHVSARLYAGLYLSHQGRRRLYHVLGRLRSRAGAIEPLPAGVREELRGSP